MYQFLFTGDTLTERGYLYAGQFCYLMAAAEFGTFANRNAKLVLILGDRAKERLEAFATNEAVQATEVLEYAQKLSSPDHVMPSLQAFKFAYAVRLMDHGMASEALHYLEEISRAVAKRPSEFSSEVRNKNSTYSVTFKVIVLQAAFRPEI